MKEKWNIYIGLNDKDTKQQEKSNIEYREMLKPYLDNNDISGATIYFASGYWEKELENTLVVSVLDVPKYKVYHFCNAVKLAFNQTCIMIEKTFCDIDFI